MNLLEVRSAISALIQFNKEMCESLQRLEQSLATVDPQTLDLILAGAPSLTVAAPKGRAAAKPRAPKGAEAVEAAIADLTAFGDSVTSDDVAFADISTKVNGYLALSLVDLKKVAVGLGLTQSFKKKPEITESIIRVFEGRKVNFEERKRVVASP